MKDVSKKYGLSTAIAMIIGICIGSGIFFKSDNILVATNGSIGLGVLLFSLAAVSIIFGSLSISELASRTDQAGGLVSYAETFLGKPMGCAFGWFQTFIYFPTITAVVSWVVGVYISILFHLGNSLLLQLAIGYVFLIVCFAYNLLIPRFGAAVQNATAIIKLIPLFLLGICGMIFGDPVGGFSAIDHTTLQSAGILTALGPIAYSFDGWIVSTSISHELHDAKRNMPRALMIAPLVVLGIYIFYFVGISCYVGPEQVIALGDEHVSVAAENLLGAWFSKAVIVFVIISVIGTVNGLVTGYIRMPYSLAIRPGMFPAANVFSRLDKHDMPASSAALSFALTTFWMVIHYFVTTFDLLPNSDISEGAIVISYLFYVLLYYRVYKMYRSGEIKSVFRGIICPVLATFGSLTILSGGVQNSMFWGYLAFSIAFSFLATVYYRKNSK